MMDITLRKKVFSYVFEEIGVWGSQKLLFFQVIQAPHFSRKCSIKTVFFQRYFYPYPSNSNLSNWQPPETKGLICASSVPQYFRCYAIALALSPLLCFADALTTFRCRHCVLVTALLPLSSCSYALAAANPKTANCTKQPLSAKMVAGDLLEPLSAPEDDCLHQKLIK